MILKRCAWAVLLCGAWAVTPAQARDVAGWEESATDVLTGAIPLGTLFYTYKYDDGDGRKQFYRCVLWNEAANSAARLAFNQTSWGERPNGHEYGFPSGHVGFISSAAAFIYWRYGWQYGLPFYSAVAYVGWERIATDHHYTRDVVAAMALSQAIAIATVTRAKEIPEVQAFVTPEGAGVQWTHNFGG